MKVSALIHTKKKVGKTIKSSKSAFVYEFLIGEERHEVIVQKSKLTRKTKIIHNNTIILNKRVLTNLNHKFSI